MVSESLHTEGTFHVPPTIDQTAALVVRMELRSDRTARVGLALDCSPSDHARNLHSIAMPEAPMRMSIMLSIAVAIAAIGFGVKSGFIEGTVDQTGSIATLMTTSKTISPHEIHLNYKAMKELPVNEVKEPF
jgi:hypothetical protein